MKDISFDGIVDFDELSIIEDEIGDFIANSNSLKFEIDIITTPNILSEQEVKQFIEKTNPYISKEREIRKYTKKANILFLIKEKLSEIYDQMVKPSYYLVFDENKNDFVKALSYWASAPNT